MTDSIRIAIIEDDPYARDMIAMLLARDWRTCVVLELSSNDASEEILEQLTSHAIDLAILDVEMSAETEKPFKLAQVIWESKQVKKILYLGTSVSNKWLRSLSNEMFGGFLIKSEIRYALVPAVVESYLGKCVITPGVEKCMDASITTKEVVTLSGQNLTDQFHVDRRQIIRLGLIFNLSHHDIADELHFSYDWCAKVISDAYDELGLQDIQSGSKDISECLPHPRIKQVIQKLNKSGAGSNSSNMQKNLKEKRTLAFHLMTIPSCN